VIWREGTKGKLSSRFAWLRVWPGSGWAIGECAGAGPVWLLFEEQADGEIKYALSNLPRRTSRIKAVRLWKSRSPGSYPHGLAPSLGRLVRPEVGEEVAEVLVAEALEEPLGHERDE
jgi:hypothetical protein